MRRISTIVCALAVATAVLSAQTMKPIPAPPDVKAPPANAAKTSSGLASKVLKAGTGKEHPKSDDFVTVNYTGWTTDGKMFDSSIGSTPLSFPLNGVIAGWTEGLQLMVAGETRRLWIPESLAYHGQTDRPRGMLVFDVDLISFIPSPTKAPADVKGPPSSAKRTASGLAYQVLTPGKGTRRPRATDSVTVNYSGWTTDGKLFDSTVARGEPLTFSLNGVIKGWTEGLQLMVEGEKTRFWIPEALAYQGGNPKGMLVFDVELITIK